MSIPSEDRSEPRSRVLSGPGVFRVVCCIVFLSCVLSLKKTNSSASGGYTPIPRSKGALVRGLLGFYFFVFARSSKVGWWGQVK